MKRLFPVLFGLLSAPAFAGNGFPGSGNEATGSDTLQNCREVLVVVYGVTGEENYSKVRFVNVEEKQITAVDPYERLADGVYLIVATSDQEVYRQTLVISNGAGSGCKKEE